MKYILLWEKIKILQLLFFLIHVFFYKHNFFWRPGLDTLSQNLKGGLNYASDMLILVYYRVHL